MKLKAPLSALTIAVSLALSTPLFAADHAEAPLVESDAASDIADVYAFLDPNDNSKAVLAFDVHGFIVPGENGNLGGFDSSVSYQFNIENTGDAVVDKLITVNFSELSGRGKAQRSTIILSNPDGSGKVSFTGPTSPASATAAIAPKAVVKTDPATGISFFAGVVDDPFFFDIPGFNRFAASVLSGKPDASLLNRGRDTFAGYNSQMITLRVPVAMLKGTAGDVIGISATTLRNADTLRSNTADPVNSGPYQPIDRMGVPTINTVLIPFPRKNEYNRASTTDDAAGKFAGDIVGTLTALGTDAAHIGILADVAVTKGDMLRLNTAVANTGKQGGNNAGAGFPNGRRPVDDVIDTVLFLVTNEGLTTGDNVNANDKVFRNSFPFFAASHQPLPTGTLDDNTRN